MFNAECKKIVHHNIKVSKDIVDFCKWIMLTDELGDEDVIFDFIDDIACRTSRISIEDSEINIEYE